MRIVIITKNLPPAVCGIGDHSVMLGEAIRAKGHSVTIIAGNGDIGADRCVEDNFWLPERIGRLAERLKALKPDHVILQYTPLMYALQGGRQNPALAAFWAACSREYRTSIILHETYFRACWHLPSLIRGTFEKKMLKAMVLSSHNVFTASQPLLDEVKGWSGSARVCLLPIGANFVFQPVDRERLRTEWGIASGEIVLALFGGGKINLRKLSGYIDATDALLREQGIGIKWLLLGGVKKEFFSLKSPVISPGFLPSKDLGEWLQLADIFLMPQILGLSAKRGTLMAAMQHGLPVVGTSGVMTDKFWEDLQGVVLVRDREGFAEAVLSLSKDSSRRLQMGHANRDYHDNFLAWHKIADKLLGFAV